MFLLLSSTKTRALIQLVTGFGKSMMFGLMARYLNLFYGKKVAVVVPNEVLVAIQQQKYSPWASKIGDNLFNDNADIHYCTYDDLLTGKIPTTTILLVDEIDSLFFTDKVELVQGRLLSAVLLLNKYKVIGMTATFRGDQGQAKLSAFLKDSLVIKTGAAAPDRILALDVYGKLKAKEIDDKVIEVAKAKQLELPVIVILPSIEECQEMEKHFQRCHIFGKGRVAEQLSCLNQLSKLVDAPWPVVLTTAETSLG